MTYLQLCQRLRQECGVSGTGPSTVTGQTGEMKRLVDWIAEAWMEIQEAHEDWKFQRLSASWTTTLGQAIYTTAQCGITAGTFARWIPGEFRQYLTASGTDTEMHLGEMSYERWRGTYQFGPNRGVNSTPMVVAITPADSIALGPYPLAGYTITGDYYRSSVLLAADSDVPALPTRHNPMMIVYRAMMMYGIYEAAPEVFAMGKSEFDTRMARLERDQLPEMGVGGALA